MKKSKIFGTYDIRGKWGSEIDGKITAQIGEALVIYLKKEIKTEQPIIVVSRDRSKWSDEAYKIMKQVLLANGAELILTGEATTPWHNFMVWHEKADGGVMVTASHLGEESVGFKLSERGVRPIKPAELVAFMKEGVLEVEAEKTKKALGREKYLERYVQWLGREMTVQKKFKIAIDASGSVAGEICQKLFKEETKIKIGAWCFNKCEHQDNPLIEKNRKKFSREVGLGGFDLGVMFDGDGDRIIFFDEKGKFINPGVLTGILIKYLTPKVVVGNVAASRAMREATREAGGRFVESRTGHVFMKELMRTYEADLGAEHSGHIYFKEMNYAEDPILALLKMLKVLSETDKKLSELAGEWSYWQSGEINIEMENQEFKRVVKKLINFLKKDSIRVSEMDGLKIEFRDWWFVIRESQTEELVRLNVEADNKKIGESKLKEVREIIK